MSSIGAERGLEGSSPAFYRGPFCPLRGGLSPRAGSVVGAGGTGWGMRALPLRVGGSERQKDLRVPTPFPLWASLSGGMSRDGRGDTKEPGRQQACYLSQSEGEDLASRPCRTRGCPRQEGTQGLRSLWAKRTELLRTGGGQAGPPRALVRKGGPAPICARGRAWVWEPEGE